MRGLTVTDSILARARRQVVRDLGERYFGSPELTLFSELRDLGMGVSDEALIGRAAGRPLKDVTAREVSDRLKRLYVPANAVLALAGNLEGVDLRALVRGLFDDIPGGSALREPPAPSLTGATRAVRRASLDQPLGAVGVIAPAITDSLHPYFYLSSLVIGRYCEEAWGKAPAPLPARFRYPVLADPQIVQFFPPVRPDAPDPEEMGNLLLDAVETLAGSVVEPAMFEELRVNHAWVLGGPLTPPLRERVRQHAGTLQTLASSMALRALWGSEAFWATYRQHFMDSRLTGGDDWIVPFQTPQRQIRLLLTPAKR